MANKLVIVESPAKAVTINKILGKEYKVMSSVGHVRDLPVKTLGVDVKKSFAPKYVIVKGKKKIIDDLKKAAKESSEIYLAPDPDREGEAIAWHLYEILSNASNKDSFFRVQYNEITPHAVRSAFENPGQLDYDRINAQQARRILDRLVGYTVSPMLWRRIRRGLSAGRVQSVALRLVCERENEILNFKSETYWVLGARVAKKTPPEEPFLARLIRIDGKKAEVKSAEASEAVVKELSGSDFEVEDISTKLIHKHSSPPYITSSLQQAGSSYCGFSPKRTMSIAQKLYEGVELDGEHVGLITYMRTDSFAISDEAMKSCRDFIKKEYGEKFCPETPNRYKNRGSAQEAHEAIRPTDVNRTPESFKGMLSAPDLKLYTLIWKRFVASQMSAAAINQRTVKIKAGAEHQYVFQATSSEVLFPGYMKVAGSEVGKGKKDEEEQQNLPELQTGERLKCLEVTTERKETQPPPRFSEASLVRVLESNGVGRPSTYAQILSTLEQREYVKLEKRSLSPTNLGMQVNETLVSTLGSLFDVGFTASMEKSLDEIEAGSIEWTKMLGEFYDRLMEWMSNTKLPPADKKDVRLILNKMKEVREWAPAVKRGKRTYSDADFVKSLEEQLDKGEKDISQRQMLTLLRIACHYREQVDSLEDTIKATGNGNILDDPSLQPPKESTLEKLDLLESVGLDQAAADFIASLAGRARGGRCLSEAQLNALDNMVMANLSSRPDFDELKKKFGLEGREIEKDNESGPMLEFLKSVREWNPSVTRGKRVFDDRKFYESLSEHFAKKGYLSIRQRAALGNLVGRYRGQITGTEKTESVPDKASEADDAAESGQDL